MELMSFLVVAVIVGGALLFGFAGWAAIGMSVSDSEKIKALEANPGPILDALFDGSAQVIYAPKVRSGGLTTPTLVKGAVERGYKMTAETGTMAIRQVVFDKL